MYARPANSGPGPHLPHGPALLLGDKDPKDPVKGWDKTWAYLKELGECIEYYPTGTGATMKELGEGSRDIIVSTTGWDINPRVLGIVPKEAKVGDPRGLPLGRRTRTTWPCRRASRDEKLAVLLDLMAFMLKPEAQAYTYDEGYFYPGPGGEGRAAVMAPEESQEAIKEFGRPEYEKLIADEPTRAAARRRRPGRRVPASGTSRSARAKMKK